MCMNAKERSITLIKTVADDATCGHAVKGLAAYCISIIEQFDARPTSIFSKSVYNVVWHARCAGINEKWEYHDICAMDLMLDIVSAWCTYNQLSSSLDKRIAELWEREFNHVAAN